MTETDTQATLNNTGTQPEGLRSQYQHQIVALNNTFGLVVVSILAFALLVAFLRQQARYEELVKKWAGGK